MTAYSLSKLSTAYHSKKWFQIKKLTLSLHDKSLKNTFKKLTLSLHYTALKNTFIKLTLFPQKIHLMVIFETFLHSSL